MEEFVRYQETLYKDKTNQPDFLGNTCLWLSKHATVIDGSYIGVKKTDGSPVGIEELLGVSHIAIPMMIFGIYLPQDEILIRTRYNWFARMSPKQILKSHLAIAKYMLASY